MTQIPFPPTIAEISARSAKAQNKASIGRGMKDHSDDNRACYRDPDGSLHMAYDPYDPKHPIGSTPGLGTVHARVGHYANETSGYTFSVSDFTPAEDLSLNVGTWSNPAVAIDIHSDRGDGRFTIARSEELLEASLDGYSNATRPTVTSVSSVHRIDPGSAVFMNPAFKEVVVIGEADDISEYLVGKYDVEMPTPGSLQEYHLSRPVDGSSISDSKLSMICERLRDRYTFSFEHAHASDMEVFSDEFALDAKDDLDHIDMPGL